MAGCDLVIFDCDGVLLDSEIIACRVDAEAYTRLGYPITGEEVCRRFAGMPDEAVDAALSAELDRPLPPGFRAEIEHSVASAYRTELQPIAGAAELLSSLQVQKCVASSSRPAKLALGLIETGLYELVYPDIFSTRLVARGKPHPDIFLYAAERMSVAAAACVVVEDSVAGVQAAKSAGMRCIGFVGGSHCGPEHGERLFEAGADRVVDQLASVRMLVG